MVIGIVGLGLIGGSMAKTIQRHGGHTVLGYDISEAELTKAELLGAIDGRLHDDNLPACHMVIIALYVTDIINYIKEKAGLFGENAVVVDCGGVKQAVYDGLGQTTKGRKWRFIGGHPMAGREFSGLGYAKDDLFENASMILTPDSNTPLETIAQVKEFFLNLGFRRVVFSTAEQHDEMIAYTSQMAHIVSNAYVRSQRAGKHKGFSAGSFQDMTRVARMNETMWTELFLLNKKPLLPELDGIIERLQEFRKAIASNDENYLTTMLHEGSELKKTLG